MELTNFFKSKLKTNPSDVAAGLAKPKGDSEKMDVVEEQVDFEAPARNNDKADDADTQMDTDSKGKADDINTEDEDLLLQSPSKMPPAKNKPKVCGSVRKRLKFYLQKGICREKAEELSKMPMAEGKKQMALLLSTSKRDRSLNSTTTPPSNTPKRQAGQTDKRSKSDERKVSFAEVAKTAQSQRETAASTGIKMGIIPTDYPTTTWSTDQLTMLQRAILDRVRQLKKGDNKPSFNSCTFRPGWLSVVCSNLSTAQWLRENLPQLKTWENAALKLVEESEVPRPQIFIGYFPEKNTESNESILDLVEGQNNGLRVGDWRVLHRTHRGATIELTIAVDPISAKKIAESSYQVNYGFGRAKLHPKTKTVDKRSAEANEQPQEQPCSSKQAPKATAPRLVPGYSLALSTTTPSSSSPVEKAPEADQRKPNPSPKRTQRKERTEEERLLNSGRAKKVKNRSRTENRRNGNAR